MAVERCIDRGTPGGRGWRRSAGGGNVDQHWAQRSWGWSHARGVVWRSGRSRASVDPVANYLVSLQHRPLHSHPLPGSAAPDARSAVRHGHAPNRPAHGRISNKPSKPSPPALGQTRQLEATTADRRSPPRVHSPPLSSAVARGEVPPLDRDGWGSRNEQSRNKSQHITAPFLSPTEPLVRTGALEPRKL